HDPDACECKRTPFTGRKKACGQQHRNKMLPHKAQPFYKRSRLVKALRVDRKLTLYEQCLRQKNDRDRYHRREKIHDVLCASRNDVRDKTARKHKAQIVIRVKGDDGNNDEGNARFCSRVFALGDQRFVQVNEKCGEDKAERVTTRLECRPNDKRMQPEKNCRDRRRALRQKAAREFPDEEDAARRADDRKEPCEKERAAKPPPERHYPEVKRSLFFVRPCVLKRVQKTALRRVERRCLIDPNVQPVCKRQNDREVHGDHRKQRKARKFFVIVVHQGRRSKTMNSLVSTAVGNREASSASKPAA